MLVFTRFLTEHAAKSESGLATSPGIPRQGNAALDVYLETLLEKALPWAQACAMMQPLSLGLADKLRRNFYPHLAPENIEHLVGLPGTTRGTSGLRFSNEVLAELRKGFAQRHDEADQEQILNEILNELRQTWTAELENDPDLKGSFAELSWKRHFERVRLELDPDRALENLSKLSATPLKNAIKADFEFAVFPESKQGGVPIRKKPETQDARRRFGVLAENSGVSVLDHYPLKRWQRALMGLLLIVTAGLIAWTLQSLTGIGTSKLDLSVTADKPIRASVAVQVRKGSGWETIGDPSGLPLSQQIDSRGAYRLAFYLDSQSPAHTVGLDHIDQNIAVQITTKAMETMPSETGKLTVTNNRGEVLNNAQVTVRNPLFSQTLSAARTLELPVGRWEFKVETANGIGSAWQSVELSGGQKQTLELEARYFRDPFKSGSGRGPSMVPMPAGTFSMGDLSGTGQADERPVHEVRLDAFAIGQHEVSFEEYDAFSEATGREKPDDFGWGRGKQPVINVSWEDATAYAAWLSGQTGKQYRLPAEAEWEYAARAGSKTAYWWGDDASHEHTNYGKDEFGGGLAEGKDQWVNTAPVGSFSPNPFGIFDAAGNVSEWTGDWYDDGYYEISSKENPQGPESGSNRVIRGGGWFNSAGNSRSAYRDRYAPGYRGNFVGFRLARTDPQPSYPFTLGRERVAEPVTPAQERVAEPAPFRVFVEPLKDGGKTPEMVFLPGGTFAMGDIQGDGDEDERPVHDVKVNAFAIGQHEVTNEEFVAFVNAVKPRSEDEQGWFEPKAQVSTNRITGKSGDFRVEKGYEKHPVVNVSWHGAQAYARWLGEQVGAEYRLPTEAEWEYAVRAGTKTSYHFGNDQNDLADYAWYAKNSGNQLHPVGKKKPNNWGLRDMHGNVWEWVGDWYSDNYYANSPKDNPQGPEKGSFRVFRGGSWNFSARGSRSAIRDWYTPGYRFDSVGFRLARTVTLPFYPVTLGASQESALGSEKQGYVPYQSFHDNLADGVKAPDLIFIPGGRFDMGDIQGKGEKDEKPVHEVTVSDFVIGKYEVTVGEFQRFIEESGYKIDKDDATGCWTFDGGWKPSRSAEWLEPGFKQTENNPVTCVSWNDAMAYIQWLTAQTGKEYRLLTEAEWEYAARAGTKTRYHFGNDENDLAEYAWYSENSGGQTHPVGNKKANAWGLNDMHGNVWEWVGDWYANDYYAMSPKDNPRGPEEGSSRVIRGGSWNFSARSSRSAYRFRSTPGDRYFDVGFRLARNP